MVFRKHECFKEISPEEIRRDEKAINKAVERLGLYVSEVVTSPKAVQYKIILTPDCNIRQLERSFANIQIALNDDNITAKRTGAEYIITKRVRDNDIYLGDLITRQFFNGSPLAVALGKDMDGHNIYANLAKAPHMLVAGTTGSGKSIFLHSLICSLLVKNPAFDLYLVDVKKVELGRYASVASVMTEAPDAVRMLYQMVQEMENRYSILAANNCRDIDEYVKNGGKMKPAVIVIDEFADLILTNRTVEQYVVRLAQKSRACGIHLVIATQRPTRDVITGLIKTNIPTRVCSHVPSAIDSRIILDRKGAEQLTGKGDMLYLANGAIEPIRISGCLVTPPEIDGVIKTSASHKTSNVNQTRIYGGHTIRNDYIYDDKPTANYADAWKSIQNDEYIRRKREQEYIRAVEEYRAEKARQERIKQDMEFEEMLRREAELQNKKHSIFERIWNQIR